MRGGALLAGGVALLAAAAAAAAADTSARPLVGPPPAWVRVAEPPRIDAKLGEAAVRFILHDQQLRLSPDGDELYTETMLRAQTAEGLPALGTVALPWKPETGTLTVHRLRILRDGAVIDLLGKEPNFTVVRRENNLERATLDGVLTAVLQPEDVRVGDVLDIATTYRMHDPVTAGHSEGGLATAVTEPVDHLRMRALWNAARPVRWRAGEGLPPIRPRTARGVTELAVTADDLQPLVLPKGAPPRFARARFVETTDFASWADLARLFAPLYAEAATLKPGSPLLAEVARIAAASSDPVRRIEAALALVQGQVRYVALALGDGGLRPATAEQTWSRRYGDCKGKTTLLVALLSRLGIDAVPAIVSASGGDGLDERLPMVRHFDHVLVRATTGGKTYWLDGTRTGDRRLADLEVPAFDWALPLRAQGAALERLVVPPPDRPTRALSYKVDFSAGISRPAPFHVEEETRGDAARGLRLGLANLTPAARDRALRDYMTDAYPRVTIGRTAALFDEASGTTRLTMDGMLEHDWNKFWYEPQRSGLGFTADFARPDGIGRDAPYAVGYPRYVTTREEVVLPNGGVGFTTAGDDLARTIAGVEYRRTSSRTGGIYRITTSERALVPEFPASEAAAAQKALRALDDDDPAIKLTRSYLPTAQEKDAILAGKPETAKEYFQRGMVRQERQKFAEAIADFDQALVLEPANDNILAARAYSRSMSNKTDLALADADAALKLNPRNAIAHRIRAHILLRQDKEQEALAEVDQALVIDPENVQDLALRAELLTYLGRGNEAKIAAAGIAGRGSPIIQAVAALRGGDMAGAIKLANEVLATQPDDPAALAVRARAHAAQRNHAAALADAAAALRHQPQAVDLYLLRANSFTAQGNTAAAIAEARALVAVNPGSDDAHVTAAKILAHFNRTDEAMGHYAKALAIRPSIAAYLNRAESRPRADIIGRRADLEAAARLGPTNPDVRRIRIRFAIETHDVAAALPQIEAGLKDAPGDARLLSIRGIAYTQGGRSDEAERDFSSARAAANGDAAMLNSLCFEKAALGVALPSALADCDAAVKGAPNEPAIIDSRAFVLLRLGRYADAIADYDTALKLRPTLADSLVGRGLARRRTGMAAAAAADLAAARRADPKVFERFAGYGLAP